MTSPPQSPPPPPLSLLTANLPYKLSNLANLNPPSLNRAWLTTPHPTLPIVATATGTTCRIYSLTSFTLLSTVSGGHKRSIRTCAWRPGTGKLQVLATGSFDASAGIWEKDENEEDGEGEGLTQDGGNAEGVEKEEEEGEWRFSIVLDGHESEIKSLAWSTGGNLLATCSRDKSVWIWEDVSGGTGGEGDYETVAVMQEHEGDVKSVAWHPEEEVLVSGSYDDEIRIWKEDAIGGDDWGCVAVLRGHEGTVWEVGWERVEAIVSGEEEDQDWIERRRVAGPRIVSCSDDGTVRIWRKVPRQQDEPKQSKLSIIRATSRNEEWIEESRLPTAHVREVYSACWSKRTGRIVSTGGDGRVAIYEERWKEGGETEWKVVAQVDGAHGVFEVNHVTWARRVDRGKDEGREEEVVVSSGDDGEVKVWNLDRLHVA